MLECWEERGGGISLFIFLSPSLEKYYQLARASSPTHTSIHTQKVHSELKRQEIHKSNWIFCWRSIQLSLFVYCDGKKYKKYTFRENISKGDEFLYFWKKAFVYYILENIFLETWHEWAWERKKNFENNPNKKYRISIPQAQQDNNEQIFHARWAQR